MEKGKIDNSTILVGDFTTPLGWIEQLDRRSTGNRELEHHKPTKPNRQTYNTPPNNCGIHIFSNTRGTVSRIDHMLSHKASFNKFKRLEIIKYLLPPQWDETRNK